MTINLFDDETWLSLRPLTFTRPVGALRLGILTIAEKWEKHLKAETGFLTQDYLQQKYPLKKASEILFINGSVCPDERLADAIQNLKQGEALFAGEILLAVFAESAAGNFHPSNTGAYKPVQYPHSFQHIVYPEHLFSGNAMELKKDYELLTRGKTSAKISSTNTIIGEQFFAEEGAKAECATFNTEAGPVYLAAGTEVWEGTHIRGGFALCENSVVKMGTKIYGATTIGPFSKVGGEIKNSIIIGNSQKGHEGYLGDSVMGEWCNIGADSNNSNMKNNYGEVKLWDYTQRDYRKTGLQFCGMMMADHGKLGINTMLNTGTVTGVGANVFGAGFPPKFIPDFSWGGKDGLEEYHPEKMLEAAGRVFERRSLPFDDMEKSILKHVFEQTQSYRNF